MVSSDYWAIIFIFRSFYLIIILLYNNVNYWLSFSPPLTSSSSCLDFPHKCSHIIHTNRNDIHNAVWKPVKINYIHTLWSATSKMSSYLRRRMQTTSIITTISSSTTTEAPTAAETTTIPVYETVTATVNTPRELTRVTTFGQFCFISLQQRTVV